MSVRKPEPLVCPVCSNKFYDCYLYAKHVSDHADDPRQNTVAEIEKAVMGAMSAEFEIEARTYGESNPFADGARGMRDTVINILTQAERGELPREE